MLKRYAYKNARTKQRYKLRGVSVLLLLTVIFFTWLLSGCATTSQPAATMPRIPEPPAPTMQQPPESYQQSALKLLQRWRAMLTHSAGGVLRDELEAVDVLARILNVANSGKLGMVRASLAHHGAAHLLPTLPVYAIDAPTTATSAPASSMPTASLTVLLGEHDIGVSAVTANKMLANAGLLEAMERPSSKGVSKRFWSVTDAGLKYGKNVTSPSNPKETQPHWYRDTFNELVRLHLVA